MKGIFETEEECDLFMKTLFVKMKESWDRLPPMEVRGPLEDLIKVKNEDELPPRLNVHSLDRYYMVTKVCKLPFISEVESWQ